MDNLQRVSHTRSNRAVMWEALFKTPGSFSCLNESRDPPQIVKKADNLTLLLKAEKDGKIRASSMGWDEPVIVLPGHALEIVWVEGQIHVLLKQRSDTVLT